MVDWPEIEKKYYMRTFDHIRLPVTLVKGEGARVWDDKGKEYLDFFAGLAVNSLGNCHPVVTQAVVEQVKALIQTKGAALSNICDATVFLKNPEDIKIWHEVSGANGLDKMPQVCMVADVCRDDLLFELDANVAVLAPDSD